MGSKASAIAPPTTGLETITECVEQATDEAQPITERDDTIACAQCATEVTRHSLAVRQGGGHEHTRRNPAGYSWTIACYRDAPGCASAGELTTEASWFAGYAWCYAACAGCRRHLGWWFVGTGPSFVALIVTRITR
jgi:hypothetical protein